MPELVFVIVIIGILSAIAVPRLIASRDDAKYVTIVRNINNVVKEAQSYYIATGILDFGVEPTGNDNAPVRIVHDSANKAYFDARNANIEDLDWNHLPWGGPFKYYPAEGVKYESFRVGNDECFNVSWGLYADPDGTYPFIAVNTDNRENPSSSLCKKVQQFIRERFTKTVQGQLTGVQGVVELSTEDSLYKIGHSSN